MEQVKIKLNGGIMPKKATKGAAAFDLYVPEDVEVKGGRQIVNMGFCMEIPHGYAATIQPRSGFSAKGIEVKVRTEDGGWGDYRLDSDVKRGLIDEDYRGNVGVILMTREYVHSATIIKKGTRIAQMQIVEVPHVELIEAEELSDTDRGEGGFGHNGAR
jgi:dUTP pyrophosphatase